MIYRFYIKFNGNWCWTSPTWSQVQFLQFEVQFLNLKFNEAKPSWTSSWEIELQIAEIELEWSCTRWSTTDSDQVHRGRVEVQRGEAELDFNSAEMDLTEVARGEPALTPLKATESKSKFNEAKPSWTWTWTRWPWAEVARGGTLRRNVELHCRKCTKIFVTISISKMLRKPGGCLYDKWSRQSVLYPSLSAVPGAIQWGKLP